MNKYVAALIAVMISSTAAMAQLTTIFNHGAWTVAAGEGDSKDPMCAMSTYWADGRYLGIKYISSRDKEGLIIHINRDSWRIPSTARMDIKYEFDAMGPWTYTGARPFGKNGSFIELSVKVEAIKTFMREFHDARRMIIQFPGSEPNWVVNMTGSAANAVKFAECVGRVSAMKPSTDTQPFSNPSQPFNPSTQPFSDSGI